MNDAHLWHPWLRINRLLRDAARALERRAMGRGKAGVQKGRHSAK
jgi:hypothetical protein